MQALESARVLAAEGGDGPPMHTYATPSPFPPTFDGNPWAYGFGLFGDVVAAALSLTLLFAYLFEERRFRAVRRIVDSPVGHPAKVAWTPLFLYRATTISLLLFVVMRSLPDAIWMLAWGEVDDATIRLLLAASLVSDGLSLIPLLFATLCWCWGRQVIPQMLVIDFRSGVTGGPPWQIIWKNARIVFVVLAIAVGVTIGKASA